MNREELMKKLELARVGYGTQTYNDVVLTLTKEETLELLKYIEQLEKENQNLKEVYAKLIEKYGDAQIIVAIEELSELQKELCKALRNKSNYDNIVEEIADVEIMLEQMKIYFNILNKDLERMKKLKIKRTKERLGL